MNVFLIPYTWMRHVSMALWCAGGGLMAWWLALTWLVWMGAGWSPSWDGPLLMCFIASSVAAFSQLGEGNLRRQALPKRVVLTALAGGLTFGLTAIWYLIWHGAVDGLIFSGPEYAADVDDASLVSLRYRFGAFAMGGLATGIGPMIVRKGRAWMSHILGGIGAGLAAAAVWHVCNSIAFRDLYLAGAAMGVTWGFVYGLLSWPVPDELYAGWLRVLSNNRFGRRIPVDALQVGAKERFVGHFPRGLDLFLPVEDGVQELHVSVAVDRKQEYRARGLSLQPTVVRRLFSRIDLRYDPRRPAPLATRLRSGDRVEISDGNAKAEFEFIMLPREEQ